ncbi:dihydroorotate dehydrogenase [Diatrype stigma]|uniref:Dihydroorotate dehydrogenase n=1 Tax=Diatrype stigma TaxID=117547 RepID=A0AAN9UUG6_9PEZI
MDNDDDGNHHGSPPQLQPPPPLRIFPPLLNSACPWATTLADLTALFECPSTGAVTTRTSLLGSAGFPHDDAVHRYTFFDPCRHEFPRGGGSGGIGGSDDNDDDDDADRYSASLNTLGYSPVPLDGYLGYIRAIAASASVAASALSSTPPPAASSSSSTTTTATKEEVGNRYKYKYFIVSVTGTPDEVAECYRRVARLQAQLQSEAAGSGGSGSDKAEVGGTEAAPPSPRIRLAVEVNLSCPNIPGKPPPAYSGAALAPYLVALRDAAAETVWGGEGGGGGGGGGGSGSESESEVLLSKGVRVPWGLKTPPYTHADQFETLVAALRRAGVAGTDTTTTTTTTNAKGGGTETTTDYYYYYSPISFLTATNTLGSCLVLTDTHEPKLLAGPSTPGVGTGIGGLAGPPLHPLALGNVATLRRLLDAHRATRHVALVGVGGVADAAAYRRMRAVGADAVAVGSALGRRGVRVFGEVEGGLGGGW